MHKRNSAKTLKWNLLVSLLALGLVGCKGITEVDQSKSIDRTSQTFAGTNQAMVYEKNPYILTASQYYNQVNYTNVLSAQTITSENYLEEYCTLEQYTNFGWSSATTSSQCFKVLNDSSSSTQPIQKENNSWNYATHTDEFYQVNLFYHLNKIQERFMDTMSFVHTQVHFNSNLSIPPATKHNLLETKSYWLTDNGQTTTLEAYSKCFTSDLNAFFSPADNSLCFGYNESIAENFRMVQDPSVIYHEFGHTIVKILMNQRNVTVETGYSDQSVGYHSQLGTFSYSEADALNEGIADYISYYMNNREAVGEWGLGAVYGSRSGSKKIGGYRPLNEDDSAHNADISTSSENRLSYPQFVHYDNNISGENVESPHNVGMIVSHYLTSLTKEFKSQCSFSATDDDTIHEEATNYVMLLLIESMAEIGDLTAKGSDIFNYTTLGAVNFDDVYFTNLNPEQSYLWTQSVNPPNFRRFFRIFGKNLLHHITLDLCPEFTIDESEQLLDDYGLLLFKSYEDLGNGLNSSTSIAQNNFNFSNVFIFNGRSFSPKTNNAPTYILNTEVNENNRKKSILVSKDFIELDSTTPAYVFDGPENVSDILTSLTFEGKNVTTTEGIAGTEYNNNKVTISPGEVVGVSLRLKNNSNSTMGGVQILANDWDHMKLDDNSNKYVARELNTMAMTTSPAIFGGNSTASFSPCIIDDFPKATEGGAEDDTNVASTAGDCRYTSRTNTVFDYSTVDSGTVYPQYELDSPQPICLVKYSDDNETKWVTQDFYRKSQLSLDDKDCLNNPSMSGSDFNPNECLIRFLPGATQAILGKINADSTWDETIQQDVDDAEVTFNASGVSLMEVNKWNTYGTEFTCRFRVRFSNCVDCFNDNNSGDDYADFQFAGHSPYKVINFTFTIED